MKKFLWFLTGFFYAVLLSSCANCNRCENLTDESWFNDMDCSTQNWLCGADSWFINGEPNTVERRNLGAPPQRTVSFTKVRVSNFTNLVLTGSYQVQLVANEPCNSVRIMGPHSAAHKVTVNLCGKTLTLGESHDPQDQAPAPLTQVIVKVGMKHVFCITNKGSGTLYGRNVFSNPLEIYSYGSGHTYLIGNMNIVFIKSCGAGNITIFGDCSPNLDMQVFGRGNVNISGRVGIQTIKHGGKGRISIIGADTNHLSIGACNCGTTFVCGHVNLKKINATEQSRVLIKGAESDRISVCADKCARIGIAGRACELNVEIQGGTRFMGRYLLANTAFVKTCHAAHANINACNSLIAVAGQNSSIYYFSNPERISRLTDKTAVILHL